MSGKTVYYNSYHSGIQRLPRSKLALLAITLSSFIVIVDIGVSYIYYPFKFNLKKLRTLKNTKEVTGIAKGLTSVDTSTLQYQIIDDNGLPHII